MRPGLLRSPLQLHGNEVGDVLRDDAALIELREHEQLLIVQVAHTKSRELLSLGTLALALGVAWAAFYWFDASFALDPLPQAGIRRPRVRTRTRRETIERWPCLRQARRPCCTTWRRGGLGGSSEIPSG